MPCPISILPSPTHAIDLILIHISFPFQTIYLNQVDINKTIEDLNRKYNKLINEQTANHERSTNKAITSFDKELKSLSTKYERLMEEKQKKHKSEMPHLENNNNELECILKEEISCLQIDITEKSVAVHTT